MSVALATSSSIPMTQSAPPDINKATDNSSFSNILGQQFAQVAQQGHLIEGNIHEAVMGKGGFEHIAQDFAEFVAQVEAIKNLADAGISAIKQIVNTPI